MKCKLITTASDISKTDMLQKSLKKYGWDYEILVHKWEGFGDKILKTYQYLKNNPDINYFFYSDSYDTIVLDTMENTLNKIVDKDCILMSAEHDSPWHFVNGGGWFCNAEIFKKAVETNPLQSYDVDQVWFTDLFLNHPEYVKLDYNCDVFQTIAFCPESDFEIVDNIKVLNTVTKSIPTFIHGNGHTPMTEFYKLI